MRGGAPAVVLVISLLFLNEVLRLEQAVGIVVLVLGNFCLAYGPLKQSTNRSGLGYAALTACFIAGYSIFDGMGARAVANAHSYAAWLFVSQFVPVAVALRETSVLFAMILGVTWLKVPWSKWRWLAVALVLLGVLMICLGHIL